MGQDIDFERRLRDRGLMPRAALGTTRLKRIPDNDSDPSNDRFTAFVIDADAGAGREAELTRSEASSLHALRSDTRVLGDDEPLVGPEEEELLAQAGRPKPSGPSARAVALKRLADGVSGPMTFGEHVISKPETAADDEAYALATRLDGERIVKNLDAGADPATKPFRRPSPEMLADAEAGVSSFQQGLRLKGQPAPARPPARPSVSVGMPGAAGAPRAPVPLRAPVREPPAEAVASTPAQQRPAGDEEFAAAQAQARSNRLGSVIGRAGQTIAESISGIPAGDDYWDGREADADLPVTELLARREADKRKALQDPTSEPSRRLQQAVAKALPGVYTPEELAQLTAEDERMVTQYGAMRQRLDERKLDISRQEQQRKEALAREDTVRADERAWQARQAAAGRAFTAGENAKNRAAGLEEARLRGAGGASATRISERGVGGFTFDPANPPSAAAAKQMADTAVARGEIMGSLDRLEALFEANGTEAGGGATQSEMESEQMNITNKLRMLNGMGVPNGADYEMLRRQVPTVTGVGAAFTRNSTIRPKFQALREQIGRTVNETAKALKFVPQEQGGQPRASGGRILVSNGSETLEIDPADLAEAQADGFREVT